jgi:hypothetical protein
MSDGPFDLAGLLDAITNTRRQFFAERENLEGVMGRAFDDPQSATDVLLSLADEFGPDQAVAIMRERPFDVGELRSDPDMDENLEAELSCIIQTQDRLDELTAKREELAPTRVGARVLNIQGEEYEIEGQELRSVERPDERCTSNRRKNRSLRPSDLSRPLPRRMKCRWRSRTR